MFLVNEVSWEVMVENVARTVGEVKKAKVANVRNGEFNEVGVFMSLVILEFLYALMSELVFEISLKNMF